VVIEDILPAEVAPYSVQPSPGGLFDGVNKVTWIIPSLGPSVDVQLWIRVRTFSTAVGNCIVNSAGVHSEHFLLVSIEEAICVVAALGPALPTPTPTFPSPAPTPEPGVQTIIQHGTSGQAEDTYVYRYAPDQNYSLAPRLRVGFKRMNAALLRFDFAAIPAGATVDSAHLEVYAEGWGGSDLPVGAYAVLTDVHLSQTTWSLAQTGLSWEAAGANGASDRRASPECTLATHGPRQWYSFILTGLVQEWVNGTLAHNGVLLHAESSLSAMLHFTGAEGENMGWRPKLVVRYP